MSSTPISQLRRGLSQNNDSNSQPPMSQMQPPMSQMQPPMSQMQPPMSQMQPPMSQNMLTLDSNMDSNMDSNDSLVNDILKEMGESPGLDNNADINVNSFNYSMDNSQVPPEKIAANFLESEDALTINEINDDNITNNEKLKSDSNKTESNTLLPNLSLNISNASLKDTIFNYIKYPLAVFIITLIVGLPQFNRLLFGKLFPNLLYESGQISTYGLLLKSLIAMIIFTLIQYFI